MRPGADRRYDVTVVGGGLIGLATAYRLLEAKPGLRLAVLEKEPELARHQSGHNSGVIHAGLYYTPGSLKARLCREGMEAIKRFADERGIPYDLCGKLVVALDESELASLAELKRRGLENGLRGLREVDAGAIRELEPHATGIRGLHIPETGIIDFRRVALAYAGEVRAAGGEILLRRDTCRTADPPGSGAELASGRRNRVGCRTGAPRRRHQAQRRLGR